MMTSMPWLIIAVAASIVTISVTCESKSNNLIADDNGKDEGCKY